MEALGILEKKFSILLGLIKTLKAENDDLKKECEQLGMKNAQFVKQMAKLNEEKTALDKEVEQLNEKLGTMEQSMLVNNKSVDVLSQEKEEAKLLIDDLIKDIDSLVKSENK